MSVPPKEIRNRITDRKRQQHGEADLAKSPAKLNRELANIAAEKGVLSVPPPCDHEWEMFTADLDWCPKCKKERPNKSFRDPVPAPKPKKRQLGRLPHGSRFETLPYDAINEWWVAYIELPTGERFEVANTSIHKALEALWKQYCRWKESQPEEPT